VADADGGDPEGPFTTEEIAVKIRRGLVKGDMQVCPANGSVWVAVSDVPDFERPLRRAPTIVGLSAPPPPPPAPARPQPTAARPQPTAARPQPTAARPQPAAARPQPAAARPQPAAARPQPAAALPSSPPSAKAKAKPKSTQEDSGLTPVRKPEAPKPPTPDSLQPPRTAPASAPSAAESLPPAAAVAPVAAASMSQPAPAPQANSEPRAAKPSLSPRTAQPQPERRATGAASGGGLPLHALVTGGGAFVLLLGEGFTLAGGEERGIAVILLGLAAILIGGQLQRAAR
jgi:hypothetical protein